MQRDRFRPLRAEINSAHVRHNFRTLRAMTSPRQFFCPMIKANAYGHGDVEVARALILEGAEHFGVALIEEGVRLRESGIGGEILVFQPFHDDKSARAIKNYKLTAVLSGWPAVQALEHALDAASPVPLDVHLKFNTGMSRLGFAAGEAPRLREYFLNHRRLRLRGICTHLLEGEDAIKADGRTAAQVKKFSAIYDLFKNENIAAHLLNSSALIASHLKPDSPMKQWGARPGISLYGIKSPVTGQNLECDELYKQIDLRPVMRVVSEIVHTQKLASGETVSYGGRFQAKRESLIGVVPVGYADGYMRRLSSKSQMACRGALVPVTGTICMDFSMVDLTGLNATIGDEVVVLGDQNYGDQIASVPAERLAGLAETNPYEILTNVSARVPRIYL